MEGMRDVMDDIRGFFLGPSAWADGDRHSILFLLRRDLETQYGKETDSSGSTTISSPFLTCLGVMVGIELLSKLWSGDPEKGKIREFLIDVTGLGETEAEGLRQLRHALAHGYSLKTRRWNDQQVFTFILDDDPSLPDVIKETGTGTYEYRVSLWRLKEHFMDSLKRYENLLEADSSLHSNFFQYFLNYGEVQVKP